MARLNANQLSGALKKGLAPIYLVSGDEPLLVQEACDSIRHAARQRGFQERELHHIEANFDWGQLLSSANSLSLFSSQKIIELRMPGGKPGDKGSRALIEYSEQPPADTLLLIVTGKLDSATTRSKWYKAIEKAGVHLAIWPIDPSRLPGWIQQRLQQAGLSADSSAIEMLASRVEGNLLAAVQEIEKLRLLTEQSHISAELMASAVADSARYNIFGLADKALLGEARAAVKSLNGLKAEGTEPLTILWALSRDLRQLQQISGLTERGMHPDQAMRQVRVMNKRQPLFAAALRRLRRPKLELLLRQANGVDRAIKGMRDADPWDELLDLVINTSGAQSLSPANIRLSLKL